MLLKDYQKKIKVLLNILFKKLIFKKKTIRHLIKNNFGNYIIQIWIKNKQKKDDYPQKKLID